jgi:hypothetical protein
MIRLINTTQDVKTVSVYDFNLELELQTKKYFYEKLQAAVLKIILLAFFADLP